MRFTKKIRGDFHVKIAKENLHGNRNCKNVLVTVQRYIKKLNLDVKKVGNEWQFTQRHIEAIKNYRLELLKKYYPDVLEMNYK